MHFIIHFGTWLKWPIEAQQLYHSIDPPPGLTSNNFSLYRRHLNPVFIWLYTQFVSKYTFNCNVDEHGAWYIILNTLFCSVFSPKNVPNINIKLKDLFLKLESHYIFNVTHFQHTLNSLFFLKTDTTYSKHITRVYM